MNVRTLTTVSGVLTPSEAYIALGGAIVKACLKDFMAGKTGTATCEECPIAGTSLEKKCLTAHRAPANLEVTKVAI